jgi:hypothetical protein
MPFFRFFRFHSHLCSVATPCSFGSPAQVNELDFSEIPREMQVWGDVLKRSPRDWLELDDDWLDWPACCIDNYIKTNLCEGLSNSAMQEAFARKLQEMCK